MPPLLMTTLPTVPVPASVPPAFTVVLDAIEPLTASVPPLIVVGPVYVLAAVRAVVPASTVTAPAPEMTGAKL
ncbi:hypothetical protein [Bradyrhizobium sp. NAS80.1]|uniref:hypothetical protein n=1 Tax=Bradyrhizobium sp. NAS80.1 TaxID=1680159 RepID=UPI001FDA93B0|nr:hypothetical protein [Bradyrhizobium sp. NAS80.1]